MPSNRRANGRPGRAFGRYYRRLLNHFGPQAWWPARSRFEVILGALLAPNTSWTNVERALGNLRRQGLLSPAKLERVPPRRLTRHLRPSGTFRQKSRAVRGFLDHLQRRYRGGLAQLLGRPTAELRAELLTLTGIGEETADSILLYAAGRPVFVIDAYTRRVFKRHGFAPGVATYASWQQLFHHHLPPDPALFNEYHALLVRVGKTYCHRHQPNCHACPLGRELEPPHGAA
jgi:endonuclease-3 related protein